MKRRQAGFSFIEILVVMGIISVLVSMVVVLVPYIQEKGKRTKSIDNVRSMGVYFVGAGTGLERSWPKYNGKNFVLWLVASNQIDRRDEKQLLILFSPGDADLTFPGKKEYEGLTLESLKNSNPDYLQLTSYAGRRNGEREHVLNASEQSKGAPIMCDDDTGSLHHKAGLVIGYVGGSAKFVEWADLGIPPPDVEKPEGILGDNSPNEDLKHLSSGN